MAKSAHTTTLSRRAAMAAPAAMTLATFAGVDVTDPDHEILELGRLRAIVMADMAAADEVLDKAVEAFKKVAPPQPDALRTQPHDFFAIGVQHKEGRFIGGEHIGTVLSHLEYNKAPFEAFGINKAWYLRCVEVVAAHEEWLARTMAVEASFGMPEKSDVADDFYEALGAIEARILEKRASTIRGLRLKAEIAKRHHTGGDHASIGSILDDLLLDS